MSVVVDIAAATICFASSCYPALVGVDTPRGTYQLERYTTNLPGYGGDLLVFKMDNVAVYAVHRVLDVPGEQRKTRLLIDRPELRNTITAGCVNVDPTVYSKLVECCESSNLEIK